MRGQVEVFCGLGKGKTAAALGICIRAASHGKQAIIVRFLKGKDSAQLEYLKKLEPEIQFFTFEKQRKCYNDLTESEKEETRNNIRNTVHFITAQPYFIFLGFGIKQMYTDTLYAKAKFIRIFDRS